MPKTTLKYYQSCYVQKTTRKNTKYWKNENFKNRLSCEGYSPCKGYSLCKMVTLGEKLEMAKTCEKPFYINIKVALCKKPLEKTPNIG